MNTWRALIDSYLDPDLYDKEAPVRVRFESSTDTTHFVLHASDLRACMARRFETEHPNAELPAKLKPTCTHTRWADAFPSDVFDTLKKTRFGTNIAASLVLDLTKLGYPNGWTSIDRPSGAHVKDWLLKTIEVRGLLLILPAAILPMQDDVLHTNPSYGTRLMFGSMHAGAPVQLAFIPAGAEEAAPTTTPEEQGPAARAARAARNTRAARAARAAPAVPAVPAARGDAGAGAGQGAATGTAVG